MYATGWAELSQFETFRVVFLVFRGRIVALLALSTSQGRDNAVLFTFSGHFFLLITGGMRYNLTHYIGFPDSSQGLAVRITKKPYTAV